MNYKILFYSFIATSILVLSFSTLFQKTDSIAVEAGMESNEEIFTQLEKDEHTLHVYYFYLNHHEKSGSSMLVYSPDGYSMLIDAGIEESSSLLSDYLNKLGIEQVDIAVATHPHHDHIGGYLQLLDEGRIKEIYMPEIEHQTETYHDFMEKIAKNDIPINYLTASQTFTLGDSVQFKVLNPSAQMLDKLEGSYRVTDINNQSLVMRMEYKNHSFLFSGDIYDEQEKQLVAEYGSALKATVMEAPHHGDDTSSSIRYIQAVSPDYAVMNANVLQSRYVLRRYEVLGVSALPTNVYGTVHIQTDGDTLKIATEFQSPSKIKMRNKGNG
ncbi:hypothetical protein GCM10008967_18460 [Bacillus carboniphilus]|uniref:Metallo-beta-lactamase domain-containing protein n=1 Tax=Bacillus carboniphilus TaxID=86663 RepID=A0ABP3FXH2_9BACI